MEELKYVIAAAVAIIVLYIIYVRRNKADQEQMRNKIKSNWGQFHEIDMTYEQYAAIAHYFEKTKGDKFFIDDITWNDLEMDRLFILMNNTYSSIGEESLYKMLRMPEFSNETLKKRNELIEYFRAHSDEAVSLQEVYNYIGRNPKISFIDSIYNLCKLEARSNLKNYIMLLLYVWAIAVIPFSPAGGITSFICLIIYSIISYYKEKAEVEGYFICLQHIVKMINAADSISNSKCQGISEYKDDFKKKVQKLKYFKKKTGLISSGTDMKGSLGDVILDYFRITTHMDLIQFNKVASLAKEHFDDIMSLYEKIGYIEAVIAVASFKTMIPLWCEPELTESKDIFMDAEEIYHPLISEPVSNSISEKKCVLLTGSNASGKSTFLKTVAINSILAQTIYTSTAKRFSSSFYRVYSSMALRDDMMNNESYYIVEIKALKRIIDAIKEEGAPVLAFVDEVLRGTNTVERIAASTQILKNLSDSKAMCFAATHDIELTHLLENIYSNYHFKEDVKDNDILFNYEIYKGRAESRNAIRLLGIMGYGENIINEAERCAKEFIKNGIWEL